MTFARKMRQQWSSVGSSTNLLLFNKFPESKRITWWLGKSYIRLKIVLAWIWTGEVTSQLVSTQQISCGKFWDFRRIYMLFTYSFVSAFYFNLFLLISRIIHSHLEERTVFSFQVLSIILYMVSSLHRKLYDICMASKIYQRWKTDWGAVLEAVQFRNVFYSLDFISSFIHWFLSVSAARFII